MKSKKKFAQILSVLLVTAALFSMAHPAIANLVEREAGYISNEIRMVGYEEALTNNIAKMAHSTSYTAKVTLEAIPCASGETVGELSASIIFNDNGYFGVELPENIMIETPSLFVLSYEIPEITGYNFRGWLHPASVQVVLPGHTLTVTGTGVIELFALFEPTEQYSLHTAFSAASAQHPNITNPAFDGQTFARQNLQVRWNAVAGASGYRLSLRNLSTDTLIYNHTPVSGTSFTIAQTRLLAGHHYRVAVASVIGGVARWTERTFRVQNAPNLVSITSVTISGTPRVGSTLSANVFYSGAVTNPAITFQWWRWNGNDWLTIAGATNRTFVPTINDRFVAVVARGTGTNVTTDGVSSAWVEIETVLTLNPSTNWIGVSSAGSVREVTVSTSQGSSWNASSSHTWLWLNRTSGTNGQNFRAYVAQNTSTASRTATVTVTAPGAPTRSFTVTQLGVAATAPSAPTSVTATAGNGSATINWQPPANNGGSAITGYQVSTNGTAWTTVGSNIRTHTFQGLTNGTSVTLRVRAVNAAGNSTIANAPAVTPRTVPGAPTNVTATAGNGNATINWQPPINTGGSAITGYQVSTNGTTWTNVGSNIRSHTFQGLTNGTSVTLRVRAVNAAGNSTIANAPAVTPRAVPSAPTNVTATAGNGSATINWQPPTNTGGSAITGYQVSTNGTTWTNVGSNIRSHTFQGLTNGTSVTLRVRAVNAAGNGTIANAPAVTPIVVTQYITITGNSAAITAGSNQRLNLIAQVHPAGVPQGVTWSSGDTNIATVAADGVVVPIAAGSVYITARSTANPNVFARTSVTVTAHVSIAPSGLFNVVETVSGTSTTRPVANTIALARNSTSMAARIDTTSNNLRYSWAFTQLNGAALNPPLSRTNLPLGTNRNLYVTTPLAPGRYRLNLTISDSNNNVIRTENYTVFVTHGPVRAQPTRISDGVNIRWLNSGLHRQNISTVETFSALNRAFFEMGGNYEMHIIAWNADEHRHVVSIAKMRREGNCVCFTSALNGLADVLGIQATSPRSASIRAHNLVVNGRPLDATRFMMRPDRPAIDGSLNFTHVYTLSQNHRIVRQERGARVFGGNHSIVSYRGNYFDPTFGLEGGSYLYHVHAGLARLGGARTPQGWSYVYRMTRIERGANPPEFNIAVNRRTGGFYYHFIPLVLTSALAAGESKILAVPSFGHSPWEVISNDSWISVSRTVIDSSDTNGIMSMSDSIINGVKMTAAPNPTSQMRTGTISIHHPDGVDTIYVHQDGIAPWINVSNPSIVTDARSGGRNVIAVTSNVNWFAFSDADWLELDFSLGVGNENLPFSVTENYSDTERTATITIRGGDGGAITTVTVTQSVRVPLSIIVHPQYASVRAGEYVQLGADVSGTGWEFQGVNWMITADSKPGTFIDGNNVLFVAADETLTDFTVKAFLRSDPDVQAIVYIDVLPGAFAICPTCGAETILDGWGNYFCQNCVVVGFGARDVDSR